MAKMKEKEVQALAVELTIKALRDGTFWDKAEEVGKNQYAYPNEIDIEGNGDLVEVWTTLDFTCKKWKEYNARGVMHEAYNPFEVQAAYLADLEAKKVKAEKAKANKEKKIAKQKAAREKAEVLKKAKAEN